MNFYLNSSHKWSNFHYKWHRVNKWLLFNAKWAIFQPYHDENRKTNYISMRWCTLLIAHKTYMYVKQSFHYYVVA